MFNIKVDVLIHKQMLQMVLQDSKIEEPGKKTIEVNVVLLFPFLQLLSPYHLQSAPHPLPYPSLRNTEKVTETFFKSKLLISTDNQLTQNLNIAKGR